MTDPRVSIVIPVYNGSNYLGEAIDSALAQTWPDVEVLVVDDGSDDDGATVHVARSYGDRIRLVETPHGGVSAALNAGIGAMTGELFAWLSHDDVYLPHKVERQVAAMGRHDHGTVVYSDYELVDRGLRRIRTKRMPDVAPEAFRLWLMSSSALHGCTLLVPRSCFDGEAFDERLATTQDYDMWFRLARKHRFVRVPEVLLKYRIHPGQESWLNSSRIDEGNRLLVGFLEEIGPSEIHAATGESPSTFYLDAAVRFKARGYLVAAERALDLSAAEGHPGWGLGSLRRLALRLAYRVVRPSFRPMYLWKRLTFRLRPASTSTRTRSR